MSLRRRQLEDLLRSAWIAVIVGFPCIAAIPGCLVVRTTEHIVTVHEDRTGEGIVHLIDIRSDAISDSLVRRDFDELLKLYSADKFEEFEKYGRRITGKQLRVRGDTLMAEITYSFRTLDAVEGLRISKEGMFLVFGPDRVVTKTNGKMGQTDKQETSITWDINARRLVYEVSEKRLPPSKSLAALYRRYIIH